MTSTNSAWIVRVAAIGSAVIASATMAAGQCGQEGERLFAPGTPPDDNFGFAVALDGERLVVAGGASDDVFGGMPRSGSVAVFRRVGGTWTQDTTLNASDAAADDLFGNAAAIDGNVVIAGAPGEHDAGTLAGAAYIHRYNGLQWEEQIKLTPAMRHPFQFFGDSVAISGDTVVIGAWGDNEMAPGAGAAYVYRFENGAWAFEQKLTPTEFAADANFGGHVAIDGDLILVAAEHASINEGMSTGIVYAFRRIGAGQWIEEAILIPAELLEGEAFAVSVALDNGLALVGASYQDPNQPDPNNPVEQRWTYVFDNTFGEWADVGRLMPASPRPGEIFGLNAALQGRRALIGSFHREQDGSAYLFDVGNCRPCPGDLDGDLDVDLSDLTVLLASFGQSGPGIPGDLDLDEDVELSDLAVMLANFGTVCA